MTLCTLHHIHGGTKHLTCQTDLSKSIRHWPCKFMSLEQIIGKREDSNLNAQCCLLFHGRNMFTAAYLVFVFISSFSAKHVNTHIEFKPMCGLMDSQSVHNFKQTIIGLLWLF